MSLTVTAIGMLALVVQIGVPFQEGPVGRSASEAVVAPTVLEEVSPVVAVPSPLEALLGTGHRLAPGSAGGGGPAVARGAALADRLSAADRAWAERVAGGLTLEEKVAQLVVAYIEGGRPRDGGPRWERARRLVIEQKVGGFIVGVGSGEGTASWLAELQTLAAVPLLVTADLEWGAGTRLRGATVLPMNMAMAAAGGAAIAYDAGRITALEARAAGIHMAFAPVADVNVNPENPVINTRSYGSDPGQVSDRVVAFIEGARSGGLLTVVKHFPGHGDTETDSHLALPILHVDRLRLEDVELRPFRAAIHAGVDGVMTAHLAVPALDPGHLPRPATLSPPILTDLLRQDLGFGGLVVTDALHMDGVKESGRDGEVAVAALLAGADILLMPPDEEDAVEAVVAAVRRGDLTEERIDRSLHRVLLAKAGAGLSRVALAGGATANGLEAPARIGREDHEAWGRRVAERSITLVRAAPRALPMAVRGRTVLAVLYDDGRNHRSGEIFERALAARGARVLAVRLSKHSGPADLERARSLAVGADAALFASFSRALPWKGALGLPEGVAALANELTAAGAPVLSFGDPYLIRQLPDVSTYLLAWSRAEASQEAAVRALVGETPITGRLPIDLPFGYRVGDGVMVPSLPGITTLPVR